MTVEEEFERMAWAVLHSDINTARAALRQTARALDDLFDGEGIAIQLAPLLEQIESRSPLRVDPPLPDLPAGLDPITLKPLQVAA